MIIQQKLFFAVQTWKHLNDATALSQPGSRSWQLNQGLTLIPRQL